MHKKSIIIGVIALALVVGAFWYFKPSVQQQVFGLSKTSSPIPGTLTLQIHDEESVQSIKFSGVFGALDGGKAFGCAPATGDTRTNLCRSAGFDDYTALESDQAQAGCGSGQIACYRSLPNIPTRNPVITVAGTQVYSFSGDAPSTFTTQDFADAINTFCKPEFDQAYACRQGLVTCNPTLTECDVPVKVEGSGLLEDISVVGQGNFRLVPSTTTTTMQPVYNINGGSTSTTNPSSAGSTGSSGKSSKLFYGILAGIIIVGGIIIYWRLKRK